MVSLILSIGILIAVYFVGKTNPFLSGVLAVVPIKVLSALSISFEEGGRGNLITTAEGILLGQAIGFIALLGFYIYAK